MKKLFILFATIFMLPICLMGQDAAIQKLQDIKYITLSVDEEIFNSTPAINFFFGELSRYFTQLGIECKVNNYDFASEDKSQKVVMEVVFTGQDYITGSGRWNYKYDNINLIFCHYDESDYYIIRDDQEYRINLGNIQCGTTPGSLISVLKTSKLASLKEKELRNEFNFNQKFAYTLLNLKDYDGFIKYSEYALNTGFYNAQLYYDRGQAFEKLQLREEAKQEYKRAKTHGYDLAKGALSNLRKKNK